MLVGEEEGGGGEAMKKTNLGVAQAVLILTPLGDQTGHSSGCI